MTVREILVRNNEDLLRGLEVLQPLLRDAQVPRELEPYRVHILGFCADTRNTLARNLVYLATGQDELLEDVLSSTGVTTQRLRVLGAHFTMPILRASPSDRLSLTVIQWLHQTDSLTQYYPAAFSDGSYGILPFIGLVPIYYLPCAEQRGLLHQPLLFHEFGHLLYRCHKPEMDDLAAELMSRISDLLTPVSLRNDRYEERQIGQRQAIVNIWYHWTQELFCDAVGFAIGGPCFLNAFSSFLSNLDRGDFWLPVDELKISRHPVTWLRVQFLADRAENAGFSELAQGIRREWNALAQVMRIEEDYHGFYDVSLEAVIKQTIDDMLIEASPREYTEDELLPAAWDAANASPVGLLSMAWQIYRTTDDGAYESWEAEQIRLYLDRAASDSVHAPQE